MSQGTHPPLFVFCALSPLAAVAMCPNSRTSPLLLRQGQALPTWDKSGARLCPGDYFLRLGVGGLQVKMLDWRLPLCGGLAFGPRARPPALKHGAILFTSLLARKRSAFGRRALPFPAQCRAHFHRLGPRVSGLFQRHGRIIRAARCARPCQHHERAGDVEEHERSNG